jgi:hypothetical protein
MEAITWVKNDGGRAAAGFINEKAGDCVTRAIVIAAELPYKTVWDFLALKNANQRKTKNCKKKRGNTADKGIYTRRKWFDDYMNSLGFVWKPTMLVGQGCKVHLKAEELPKGRLIVNVSRHMVAVIDGVIHDTHDCSREGKRCVYGYYYKPE